MLKFFVGLGIGLGVTLAVALLLMPSPLPPEDSFGRFIGNVQATFLEDGRTVELKEDFGYVDPNQKVWLAPAGSVVDGASIPQVFWSFIGGPFAGQFRNASIIHDVGCQQMTESAEDVHRTFYFACRCAGVGEAKAKALFYAVSKFGPNWDAESILATGEGSPPESDAPSSATVPPVPTPSGAGPSTAAPSTPGHSGHFSAPSGTRSRRYTAPTATPKTKLRMRAKAVIAAAKRAGPTKQQAAEVIRYFETHDHEIDDVPHVHIGQPDKVAPPRNTAPVRPTS